MSKDEAKANLCCLQTIWLLVIPERSDVTYTMYLINNVYVLEAFLKLYILSVGLRLVDVLFPVENRVFLQYGYID
jgi:hypothetical protein